MLQYLRFTSFVLGLLFLMHVLGESSAYAQQGEEGLAAKGKNVSVPKGVILPDGVNAAGLKKIGHEGRKIAVQKVLLSTEEMERKDGGRLNGRTSEISGEDSNASINSPGRRLSQDKVNDQNNMNMFWPKSSKSASLGIPRNTIKPAQFPNTNTEQYYRDSKAVSNKAASLGSSSTPDKTVSDIHPDKTVSDIHHEIYDTSPQRDETQRLLEATKEIVNLMHKDYGQMAKRKPPINNHDPWRH